MKRFGPGSVRYYFYHEKKLLLIVTLSGILYNVGMIAGPWFDGQLAQYLYDIFGGTRTAADMYALCLCYALVIVGVQGSRYVKRLYVRKFANNISLAMKDRIYQHLVQTPKRDMEQADTGALMTKVISDIDTCVEGMRKFTTEIFDTGVVMAAYVVMLVWYDWRLTLCVLVFPPIAYALANSLRRLVAVTAARSKESSGALSGMTLDRISNALTYRVYGEEAIQDQRYEGYLADYEKKMILANLWENTLQPIYKVIAMIGTVLVIWFGGHNVQGTGWENWDIAAFSTYLGLFHQTGDEVVPCGEIVQRHPESPGIMAAHPAPSPGGCRASPARTASGAGGIDGPPPVLYLSRQRQPDFPGPVLFR